MRLQGSSGITRARLPTKIFLLTTFVSRHNAVSVATSWAIRSRSLMRKASYVGLSRLRDRFGDELGPARHRSLGPPGHAPSKSPPIRQWVPSRGGRVCMRAFAESRAEGKARTTSPSLGDGLQLMPKLITRDRGPRDRYQAADWAIA
jgi:hypothetical protein